MNEIASELYNALQEVIIFAEHELNGFVGAAEDRAEIKRRVDQARNAMYSFEHPEVRLS